MDLGTIFFSFTLGLFVISGSEQTINLKNVKVIQIGDRMEKVIVYPGAGLNGEISIPSSKPHIQRALLLALLNERTTKIVNISWNTETENLLRALKQFGLKVLEETDTTILLRGMGWDLDVNGEINAEGSGMLFRTCSALAALTKDVVRIKCNESLFSRESLFDDAFCSLLNISLIRIGRNLVEVRRKQHNEQLPLTTKNSTQFISFALFVSPFLDNKVIPVCDKDVGAGYIAMTIQSMEMLGSSVIHTPGQLKVTEYAPRDITINIPSDFTSLSYVASSILSIIGESQVKIVNYHHGGTINEEHLFKIYNNFGLSLEHDLKLNELILTRRPSMPLHTEISLKELPSAAANIIAATSNLGGHLIFNGVTGINNHKCQRAFVISENIRRMGGSSSLIFNSIGVFEKIYIGGGEQLSGGIELHSYGDHRVCAANVIAALGAKQASTIHGVKKLNDGFPGFIETLKRLGANIQ